MFMRYASIQLLAYGIDLGFFLIVLQVGLSELILANVIGKFFAGLFAFIAHRRFTFRVDEATAIKQQIVRYFSLLAFNIPIASAILALLFLWISEPVIAKFIADVICVTLTYWLSKHFIFTRKYEDADPKNSTRVDV